MINMKKLITLLLLGVFGIATVLIWWTNGTSPVNKSSRETQTFVVPQGAGIKQIANDLKEQNLIKDPTVFYFLVKQMGIEKKIQAGSYKLSASQSAAEIAESLTVGTQDVWVTVPEGKRATEIAEILSEKIETYDPGWVDILVENEGYLFPDTYLFPKDATIDLIVSTMRDEFDEKYAEANGPSHAQEDIVILASMIQREAITDEEMPIIAGIMKNRIEEGMPLQIDATIQYAKGRSGAWWQPVLLAEYQSVNSPYNTYKIQGLPPGPISNPGQEALRAAANPQKTDYLYYLHDKNGTIRYAKTLDQHNANIERYGL